MRHSVPRVRRLDAALQAAPVTSEASRVTYDHAPAIALVAPGWYPDPHAPGWVRWWDGRMWTAHAQAAPAWQPPVATPHNRPGSSDEELRWLLPVGRPGSAIAAGYLGLWSLIPNPFTAIPAV